MENEGNELRLGYRWPDVIPQVDAGATSTGKLYLAVFASAFRLDIVAGDQ